MRRRAAVLLALAVLLGGVVTAWAVAGGPSTPAARTPAAAGSAAPGAGERTAAAGAERQPARRAIVVAAAGDIGAPGPGKFATARVVAAARPDHVLTLGDHAYPDGTPADYARAYDPAWGQFRPITHPSPGNHDYRVEGAAGYFGYFGAAAGPGRRGYYSFDLGAWHVVSLNSEIAHDEASAQVAWLRADLAAARAHCTLAFWHRPRFSAGRYGDDSRFVPFWRTLHKAGADVVLNGHDHNYQRYRPQDSAGAYDPVRGIREFVVGTGGAAPYALRADTRRRMGASGTFGALVLRLRAGSLTFAFVPAEPGGFRDAGTIRCH
jgi:hypothetical protein